MPRLLLSYQVSDSGNSYPDDEVNVEEFIGIKSFKAKGKRLSNREIEHYEWLEPFEPEVNPEGAADNNQGEEPLEPEEVANDSLEYEPKESEEPEKKGGEPIQMELF